MIKNKYAQNSSGLKCLLLFPMSFRYFLSINLKITTLFLNKSKVNSASKKNNKKPSLHMKKSMQLQNYLNLSIIYLDCTSELALIKFNTRTLIFES